MMCNEQEKVAYEINTGEPISIGLSNFLGAVDLLWVSHLVYKPSTTRQEYYMKSAKETMTKFLSQISNTMWKLNENSSSPTVFQGHSSSSNRNRMIIMTT